MNRAKTINVYLLSRLRTCELIQYEVFPGAQNLQFIRTHGRLERADLHTILVALLSIRPVIRYRHTYCASYPRGSTDSLYVEGEQSLTLRLTADLGEHDSLDKCDAATADILAIGQKAPMLFG
jgi:hypothetical protein